MYEVSDKRGQKAEDLRKLFYLPQQGHTTNECTLSKSCFYCGKLNRHHRSLCPKKFGYIWNESAHLVEELSLLQEDEDSTENVLISSGDEQ